VNLTTEQRTRIQQTVLVGSNVPRVNNVNFSLAVGTAVPARVRIVDVPSTLIEIYPQWRGHQYFVVRDDIVIVDRSRKVVAVVPVGRSGAGLGGGGDAPRVGGGAGALSLSSDQIRQVQMVLIEKGFSIGEPDGVLGTRTRQALIAFQRQQGFEASGRIDSRTVTALGLSNMSGQQGGAAQPSTSGQGGAGRQQPPADQNMGAGQEGNQGAAQPSTSGQGGAGAQQPAAGQQDNQGAGQPSTSGQGDQGASPPSGQGSEKMQQSPDNRQGSPSNRPADQNPQGR
jgi:peptidoglycan hydrolase-like protein with peptidoglycan-binding domain